MQGIMDWLKKTIEWAYFKYVYEPELIEAAAEVMVEAVERDLEILLEPEWDDREYEIVLDEIDHAMYEKKFHTVH